MESTYSCMAAGKTRYPRKTQTAISYEHIDREFITTSRQDAASRRSHQSRSTSLPKIATGRSIHSAKKLWEDYERIEVRSRVQRENERPTEVPPLRVPKNPHSLYKHTVKSIKPFHILHSQSDYGDAKHQLRQLYAQVTYLSNAVRNCDGSASYRGMCKRQRSYRRNDDDPLRLHWPSSDETVPIPRLLLPVTPGTNTKWYSWKVDTPRDDASPRVRRSDKRYTVSAPVSQSLDFLERYSKNKHVTISVDDEGGRRSKNSKETDAKSRDGHLSVRTIDGTDITESLASSSLSSIMRYDANQFKLKDDEGIAGKAIFLTQPETRKMTNVEEIHADVSGVSCQGGQQEEEKNVNTEKSEKTASESDVVVKGKDEDRTLDQVRKQHLEDATDIVARANAAVTEQDPISDTVQTPSPGDANDSQQNQQKDAVTEQVAIATSNELEDLSLGQNQIEDSSGHMPHDNEQMLHSNEDSTVSMVTQDNSDEHEANDGPDHVQDDQTEGEQYEENFANFTDSQNQKDESKQCDKYLEAQDVFHATEKTSAFQDELQEENLKGTSQET